MVPAVRNLDRSLGDGGMPLLGALGVSFDSYGDGWAIAKWLPTELACNPLGGVHGGVIATVLDAAMNFAVNASLEGRDRTRATLEMKTETMRPASSGEPHAARAHVTRLARQVAFAEAAVRDREGRLVSRSTGTFLLHRDPGTGT
jgi:uncharacterized protein (TIGR00369 family)